MAMIRKLKEKIKKIRPKKKAVKSKAKKEKTPAGAAGARAKKVSQPAAVVAIEAKKEIYGAQEVAIGQSKFSHPEVSRYQRRDLPQELPPKYDQDKLILQVRDTHWLHGYWEIREATFNRFKAELRDDFYRAVRVLRVYDVTNLIFNGNNANRFFDIQINDYASNWYIEAGGPGRSWCVDYGLKLPGGKFITVLRSNVVHTPLDGPSWITDEEWMIPEEIWARLYGMSFGLGTSSPVGRAWQERVKHVLSSASGGIASMASPVKLGLKERKFWMVVDCELIVYGATEPDAKVTVQDKEIKLRPDGTFTLRFALPDGKQVIPVKAVSSDKIEERVITPIVSRETKRSSQIKE